ncbi:MAG: hypothetical protein MN733_41570, partial [Nitrososphaera sp.]|nr:hypothetical protein [Nitrososphaera sp.]
KARKPRTARDPNAEAAKLAARIEKLKGILAKAQEKLAVEGDPKVAAKVRTFKQAKARLTANKRFLTMKAKKLRRLESEVVDYRKQVAELTEAVQVSQERVDALKPEIDALKIVVEDSEDSDSEGDDNTGE